MSQPTFAQAKAELLRFAEVLAKSSSAEDLRERLLADRAAPYHHGELLQLLDKVERIGESLCWLMAADLHDQGAPHAR